MEYAAIIIPTLNRVQHLKRCIDSLKRNEQAMQTDLYISVDYPPADKYNEGYNEVKEYVKTINGFMNVSIFFQEKNLGPGLNRKFLEEKVAVKHTKYIFTDDDNEFSENFLEYMNWGLEKFKDDDNIYAICARADFNVEYNDEDYLEMSYYSPYGSGYWIDKCKLCKEFLKQENLHSIYTEKNLQGKLKSASPILLYYLATDAIRRHPDMRGREDNITFIDIWENIYCIINNKKCVIPTINKVCNWGFDGSGVHAVVKSDAEMQIIDSKREWDKIPKKMGETNQEKNELRQREYFKMTSRENRKCNIVFIAYKFLGKKKFEKIVKFLSKKDDNNKKKILYG